MSVNGSVNGSVPRENLFEITKYYVIFNMILNVPPNAYVIWLISSGAAETLTSDFFCLNMALSDILFSSFGACFLFYFPTKNYFWFDLFMFSHGLIFTARPLFQLCICVECYTGVVHPVFHLQHKTLRHRGVCSCVIWLISLISCIYCKFTFRKPLYLYGFFILHALLLSMMIFCCLSVLWTLKCPDPGEKHEKKKTHAQKRRAFKIMLVITILKTIFSVLILTSIPLQHFVHPLTFSVTVIVCVNFTSFGGFIQPLLYLHRSGKLFCLKRK